jgi:hypothetical protein
MIFDPPLPIESKKHIKMEPILVSQAGKVGGRVVPGRFPPQLLMLCEVR